jgi:hypothetical protein
MPINSPHFVTASEKLAVAAVSHPGMTTEKPDKGRPRKHSSDADRVAAYRSRNVRLDVTVPPALANTLAEISSDLDCSRNVLLNSLVRFALLNRNWRVVGLFGKR